MPDTLLHMPDPLVDAVRGRAPALRRIWDHDFGTCWLVPSLESARLAKQGWAPGALWFADVPPRLVEWVCAFPGSNAPVFIEACDEDFDANQKEILAARKRITGIDSDSPAEITARYLDRRAGNAPGWTPRFISADLVSLNVTPQTRRLFCALGAGIETFQNAAAALAESAKRVQAPFVITEFALLERGDIVVVGCYGDAYASFIVGDNLEPHMDQLD